MQEISSWHRRRPLRPASRTPDPLPEKPSGLFSFFSPAALAQDGEAQVEYLKSSRDKNAALYDHLNAPRPLRWKSSPVSPTSAFRATTSKGTRKSATRCVRGLLSGRFDPRPLVGESLRLFQVYKVLVSVGQQEWFVFRRYAEFDKLYNTVSRGAAPFPSSQFTASLIYLISVTCPSPLSMSFNSYGNSSPR